MLTRVMLSSLQRHNLKPLSGTVVWISATYHLRSISIGQDVVALACEGISPENFRPGTIYVQQHRLDRWVLSDQRAVRSQEIE
jgi:hypothetical protein